MAKKEEKLFTTYRIHINTHFDISKTVALEV